MCANKIKNQSGFTLLEVIIAMTIMVIAVIAILTSQSGSIYTTVKARELNIAGWLAQRLMVESEQTLEGKPFSEIKTEELGQFPEPFEKFSWKREIKEIQFPDFSAPNKEGEGGMPEPMRILAKVLTKFFNDSIREMIITIQWKRGGAEQKLDVTTYLIDLKAEFDFSI